MWHGAQSKITVCAGCGMCSALCPYEAIEIITKDGKKISRVNGVLWWVNMSDFKPKIIVFCCNWCSYVGADLAGVSRLQINPNFRIIRTMCSGRIEPEFILNALKISPHLDQF